MNLALFDFDGTITALSSSTTHRYPVINAYGDTSEDREMLGLAHRKYYRWKEIADWSDAVSAGK